MINDIPKIDLHCHLDGSVRPETIIELAKKHNIEIPSYEKGTIMKFLVAPADCKSLVDYLKVFDIPKKVMQTEDALRRITFELYEDAAKENVKYMEVRFAPMMHTFKGLALNEVIESVEMGYLLNEDVNWEQYKIDLKSLPDIAADNVLAEYEEKWLPEKVADYIVESLKATL